MVSFITNLINGISLGSIYAIIAIGYTMVYGISKMLNFAHGDIIMVGAFVAFIIISGLNLPTALGIIAAFNYYYSVVRDERFLHRFGEMAALSGAVSLVSFLIGFALKRYTGLDL